MSIPFEPAMRSEMGAEQSPSVSSKLRTGNGEWTYGVVSRWGALPDGKSFGGTHGGITSDQEGNVYVSTQGAGILVYSEEGNLLKAIAEEIPDVHSLVYREENGAQYLDCIVQKGTPKENWLFLRIKLDGTVTQKLTAPPEAGFQAANEWRPTSSAVAPDGSIYIANGYGDSRIFRFDKRGTYRSSFAGKGDADGKCNCCHGLALDQRYEQPLLLVCDRENRRLSHFDLDGRFVRNVTHHLRRPCQLSFYQDYVVVSELEGRVTILDRDNFPVSFLGDNPRKAQWANYDVGLEDIPETLFSAAHGCHIDQEASIYISDWNRKGRVTKLARLE